MPAEAQNEALSKEIFSMAIAEVNKSIAELNDVLAKLGVSGIG